jgi:hypothetical protein
VSEPAQRGDRSAGQSISNSQWALLLGRDRRSQSTRVHCCILKPGALCVTEGMQSSLVGLSHGAACSLSQYLAVAVLVLCACSLPQLSHQLLQPLSQLTNLQHLALAGSMTVHPQPLSALGALTLLTTLQLKGVAFPVDNITLPGLMFLTALQQLELKGELVRFEFDRPSMQLGVLRNNTSLQQLKLEGLSLVRSRLDVRGEGVGQSAAQAGVLQGNAPAAATGWGGGHRGGPAGCSRKSAPCLVPQLRQLTSLELRPVRDESVSYQQQQQQQQVLSEAQQLIVDSRSVLHSLCLAGTGVCIDWDGPLGDVFLADAVLPHLTALDLRQTSGGMRQPQLTRWAHPLDVCLGCNLAVHACGA